jgi:hypothetical protein
LTVTPHFGQSLISAGGDDLSRELVRSGSECNDHRLAAAEVIELLEQPINAVTRAVVQSDSELSRPTEQAARLFCEPWPQAAQYDQISEIWGDGPRTPWGLFERLEDLCSGPTLSRYQPAGPGYAMKSIRTPSIILSAPSDRPAFSSVTNWLPVLRGQFWPLDGAFTFISR